MSATATAPEATTAPIGLRERSERWAISDRAVGSMLLLAFALLVAVSWRKWGMPEGDAGAEFTTADLIKHGAVAYHDVRYFYGPLGLYSLALAFKVFGTSLTVAYGFGLLQATAILGVFYALARQWLAPVMAGLATAVLLAIGFSGTSFNFVVPHTNSATFGLLTTLLMLLALRRGRLLAAGAAAGLVALTRPEFLAVAVGAAIAFLVATWRTEGRGAAARALWRLAVPAVLIPALIFGWFASQSGLSTLLFQDLWPVKFLHAGVHTEANWMPVSLSGAFGLAARGAIYVACIAAVILTAERWSERRHISAMAPLAIAVGAVALGDVVLRATGLFSGQRTAIEGELHHLTIGMSWLPAIAVGMFVWALARLMRRGSAPLSADWATDFALIVAAVGLSLRAYNAFTTEGSYAPYYAAPAVLVLAILHAKLSVSRPHARAALGGVLGLVAAGLAVYAVGGLYRHLDASVHTPRGTFVTTSAAAPALQRTIDEIDAATRPVDRILAGPIDGGLYFFSNRRPALHELSLLPGLIATPSDQNRAIARLQRERVTLAVLSARDNSVWGTSSFGTGYDKLIGDYLRRQTTATKVVGTLSDPQGGTYPAKGYTVLSLRR